MSHEKLVHDDCFQVLTFCVNKEKCNGRDYVVSYYQNCPDFDYVFQFVAYYQIGYFPVLAHQEAGMYGSKSDPGAKVIPKPNYLCKTAKLIPK